MKQYRNRLQGVTLLTATAVFCLGAGAAQCQRAGRSASRGTTSQSTSSQASSCANSASSSSTSSSSAVSTTSGTSTTTQSATSGTVTSARQSVGTVTALRTASNQLVVQWTGNTSNVQKVYVGVLDADGNVISQQAITRAPVKASLALTSSAKYYGVQVVYANGTTRTTYTPIP